MAEKLFSILQNTLGKVGADPDVKKLIDAFARLSDIMKKTEDRIKEREQKAHELQVKYRYKGIDAMTPQDKKQFEAFNNEIFEAKEQLKTLNKQNVLNNEALKKHKITQDQLRDVQEAAIVFGHEEIETKNQINKVIKENAVGYRLVSSLLSKVGLSLEDLANKGLQLDAVLLETAKQFIELNKMLTGFTRSTGGTISSQMIGFDRYGNNATMSNTGSLNTLAARYNFSKEDFLSSLSGFGAGNVMGMHGSLNQNSDDLQNFGIQQARIIRNYGVSAEAIQTLSQNMTQLYGVSIKNLNQSLINSKDYAYDAGLSVKQFFQNFAELSNIVGQYYIRGGIQGMQNVAGIVTKLNISVQDAFEGMKRLNTVQDLFQKQNQAIALGLTSYASNTARIFGMQKLGDIPGAMKAEFGSLARDILSMGYSDKFGNINQQGLETLQYAGFSKGEINGVQRILHENKKLGISLAELSGQVQMSAKSYVKAREFEFQNATLGEKLKNLWDQVKSLIIDPLAAVLAPLTDIVINGLVIALKGLYEGLLPIIKLFELLGDVLSLISEAFGKFAALVGLSYDKTGNVPKLDGTLKLINVFSTALASFLPTMMLYFVWKKREMLLEMSEGFLSGIKGLGKGIGGFFRRGGGAVAAEEGIQGLKGFERVAPAMRGFKGLSMGKVFGLSALGSIAGGLMSQSNIPAVSVGGAALNYGSLGLSIGAMVGGPVGAAVGAGIGALGGAIYGMVEQQKKSNDHLMNIDNNTDPSKSNAMSVVMAAPSFAGAQLASNIINQNNKNSRQEAIKAQEAIVKKQVAIQQPIINVTIPNIGILNRGIAKARVTGK